jgi:hypothetical protein
MMLNDKKGQRKGNSQTCEENFAFWTMHFLKVNEKPKNALYIQCIRTQYFRTCFGILKCYHQGVKHDLAEIGAQFRGKRRRMGAVYCNRPRGSRDFSASHDIGHLSQQDHV